MKITGELNIHIKEEKTKEGQPYFKTVTYISGLSAVQGEKSFSELRVFFAKSVTLPTVKKFRANIIDGWLGTYNDKVNIFINDMQVIEN